MAAPSVLGGPETNSSGPAAGSTGVIALGQTAHRVATCVEHQVHLCIHASRQQGDVAEVENVSRQVSALHDRNRLPRMIAMLSHAPRTR